MEMVNVRTNQNQNQNQNQYEQRKQQIPGGGASSPQLTQIDMSKLSQAELHTLSLSSLPSSAYSLHHHRSSSDHRRLVTTALFASSQKQTFSGRRPPKPPLSSDDPHLAENKSIVKFLKDLVSNDQNSKHDVNTETKNLTRKRKRGKKPRENEKVVPQGKGTEDDVAENDVDALANGDDVYGEELRKRTVGMESEEEGLGFLRGLEGQWCSRRKKRRIVEAGLFAVDDGLPAGWKLLLALRRRDGRFSVYCRRYISPSGQQFQSCKDAAHFLKSHLGFSDANLPLDQSISRVQHANHMGSESHAVAVCNVDDTNHDIVASSALPCSSVSNACEKEVSLLMIDNLPEVQVQALFECRSCKLNFDDMKAYKRHVFFNHNRTTRLIRFDTLDGRGLMILNEKLFQERSRCNNHVRLHMKNPVQDSEKSPGQVNLQKNISSQTKDVLPPRFSKMDALLQIAENSVLGNSSAGHTDKVDGSSPPDNDDLGNTGNNELTMDFGISQDKPNNDVVADSMHIGENVHQIGAAMPKGENNLSDAFQKIDRVTKFEELRLDRQKPLGHSLMNGLGSPSLPEKSKDLANNATLKDGTNSNVGLKQEAVIRVVGRRHRFMTICVWCRTEFYHETVDLETISDSTGFMCPTCKHKISGHWDSDFSVNSYHC